MPDQDRPRHPSEGRGLPHRGKRQLAELARRDRTLFRDPARPPRSLRHHRRRPRPHREPGHVVSHDVAWLSTDRRFPGEPRFPGLAAIAMVEAEVERGGKTTLARRYYLSSALLDAPTFARAVRAHWGVENRLHWVMDVVFHDDLARLRTGHGPENMAIFRHMAMNLVRQ